MIFLYVFSRLPESNKRFEIDICCPRPTSAANPPPAAAVVDRRDRQTDGHSIVYDTYRILCGARDERRKIRETVPKSSIICYASKGGGRDTLGWEVNRRSGDAITTCHGFQWFIHLLVHDLRKRDDSPAYMQFLPRLRRSTCDQS